MWCLSGLFALVFNQTLISWVGTQCFQRRGALELLYRNSFLQANFDLFQSLISLSELFVNVNRSPENFRCVRGNCKCLLEKRHGLRLFPEHGIVISQEA